MCKHCVTFSAVSSLHSSLLKLNPQRLELLVNLFSGDTKNNPLPWEGFKSITCWLTFHHAGNKSTSPLPLRGAPDSTYTVSKFHAEVPQATASEQLAQGPYMAVRAGFKPATLRTKGDESINEPPCPTVQAGFRNPDLLVDGAADHFGSRSCQGIPMCVHSQISRSYSSSLKAAEPMSKRRYLFAHQKMCKTRD